MAQAAAHSSLHGVDFVGSLAALGYVSARAGLAAVADAPTEPPLGQGEGAEDQARAAYEPLLRCRDPVGPAGAPGVLEIDPHDPDVSRIARLCDAVLAMAAFKHARHLRIDLRRDAAATFSWREDAWQADLLLPRGIAPQILWRFKSMFNLPVGRLVATTSTRFAFRQRAGAVRRARVFAIPTIGGVSFLLHFALGGADGSRHDEGDIAGGAEELVRAAKAKEHVGQWADAEALYRRARDRIEDAFGADDYAFARLCDDIATMRLEQGDASYAEREHRRAQELYEARLGVPCLDLAESFFAASRATAALGRMADGEQLVRTALAIGGAILGWEDLALSRFLILLSQHLVAIGDVAEAEQSLRRALAVSEKHLGSSHPIVAFVLTHTGELLGAVGRFQEAERVLRRAVSIQSRRLEADHPWRVAADNALARVAGVR
jgi:hypothetical protein